MGQKKPILATFLIMSLIGENLHFWCWKAYNLLYLAGNWYFLFTFSLFTNIRLSDLVVTEYNIMKHGGDAETNVPDAYECLLRKLYTIAIALARLNKCLQFQTFVDYDIQIGGTYIKIISSKRFNITKTTSNQIKKNY